MNEVWLYILACTGAVFAGFIDAVAGGGGLVQVPLLLVLFPQFSPINIIATNRLASVAGTAVASWQYVKSVQVEALVVYATGACSAIAAFSGTFVMNKITPEVFKPMLFFIILLLALYSYFNKDMGQLHQVKFKGKKLLLAAIVTGIVIGFYNGMIGPGTGTLLVFAFVSIMGMGFLQASSTAKLVNVISDLASLIGFLLMKSVIFKLALPLMACNVLGGYIGSKTAISRGNKFIRHVFLVVVAILLARLAKDVFF